MSIEALGHDCGFEIKADWTVVNKVLEGLGMRRAKAICLRYGLPPYIKRHTFKQIGVELGNNFNPQKPITANRARQIVWTCIYRHLKHPSRRKKLMEKECS